jgi:hypothetical protein
MKVLVRFFRCHKNSLNINVRQHLISGNHPNTKSPKNKKKIIAETNEAQIKLTIPKIKNIG